MCVSSVSLRVKQYVMFFAFYFVSYYSVISTREEFNFVILLFCESKDWMKNFVPHFIKDRKIENSMNIMELCFPV